MAKADSKPESKVAELLLRLHEDPEFLAEFKRDPDRVMIEAGISSEQERDALKSGNILKVQELIAKEKA